jgi:hypothetical protein
VARAIADPSETSLLAVDCSSHDSVTVQMQIATWTAAQRLEELQEGERGAAKVPGLQKEGEMMTTMLMRSDSQAKRRGSDDDHTAHVGSPAAHQTLVEPIGPSFHGGFENNFKSRSPCHGERCGSFKNQRWQIGNCTVDTNSVISLWSTQRACRSQPVSCRPPRACVSNLEYQKAMDSTWLQPCPLLGWPLEPPRFEPKPSFCTSTTRP